MRALGSLSCLLRISDWIEAFSVSLSNGGFARSVEMLMEELSDYPRENRGPPLFIFRIDSDLLRLATKGSSCLIDLLSVISL